MVAARAQRIVGSRTKTVRLDWIRLDGDTQSRVELDRDVIREYAQLMKSGHEFPPLLVVYDGESYWLVDGFHRRWAAVDAGTKRIKCQVVRGSREQARWLSYGANIEHGLRRSNDDKKKATKSALKHPKGAKLSDQKIAQHVGVSPPTVAKYRSEMQEALEILVVTERVGRDGKTYNTTNIGKRHSANGSHAANEADTGDDFGNSEVDSASAREPTPFDHLKHWWNEADETQRCLFRNWIDGKL